MKKKSSVTVKVPKPRNHVHTSTFERGNAGAGSHSKKGYNRKVKHPSNQNKKGHEFMALFNIYGLL